MEMNDKQEAYGRLISGKVWMTTNKNKKYKALMQWALAIIIASLVDDDYDNDNDNDNENDKCGDIIWIV